METIHEMYSEKEIEERIENLANTINKDYEGKSIHMICILRGSIMFFAELAKKIKVPVTMDFMQVSSYDDDTRSGKLRITKELDDEIDGMDCLIVEDIIDSGKTLDMIKKMLSARNAKSLKICTLLDKPSRREVEVEVDYIGFEIPDEFVVGYGLDYAQKYRNLPYLARLEL